MGNERRPLQPGEASPAFTLPSANREGKVSLGDLRGRPFLIGFYRGLHCPFCRRQVVQLGAASRRCSRQESRRSRSSIRRWNAPACTFVIGRHQSPC